MKPTLHFHFVKKKSWQNLESINIKRGDLGPSEAGKYHKEIFLIEQKKVVKIKSFIANKEVLAMFFVAYSL